MQGFTKRLLKVPVGGALLLTVSVGLGPSSFLHYKVNNKNESEIK
jgi:hypothetical protein